jgi:N6-adenosine-specific RNA methylase IME4
MTGELALYDRACAVLAEAKRVDEVKDVIDVAVAMKVYARQAKNHDLEADAVELRMRATLRLAELIEAQKETIGLAKGGKPYQRKLTGVSETPVATLAMQGIDKNLAKQARVLGALSDQQFESVVADARDKVRRAVRSAVREVEIEQEREERDARLIEISKGNTNLPHDRRYPIILADPAWENSISANDPRIRAPEHHYRTMPLQDICDMRVGEKLATPDAVLFLWVPASLLLVHGASVLEAWDFQYRTNIVWVKDHDLSETARRFGLGFYCRMQHEHLLIATRGERLHPSPSNLSSSVIRAPRREHSRKPDEAYELIERMYPDLPKIELFARSRRPGWMCWGNEAPPALAPDAVSEAAR